MKILVVYYTQTNHTKSLAESIASKCGADILRITDAQRRKGFVGYFMSGFNSMFKRPAKIQPVDKDAGDYDLIILGTPVWSFSLSSPMRTYISENSARFSQVAYFCTEGGSGGKRVFRQLSEITGQQPIATLELTETQRENGTVKARLILFIEMIARFTGESTLQIPVLEPS